MRVIAGKARRLQLKTPEGFDTRPTTDRIKETLFNILNPYLADADFLLSAALSFSKYAAFVENDKAALSCIRSNLKTTKLEGQAQVFALDALEAIRALEIQGKVFDVIFMDPPYDLLLEKQILLMLQNSNIIYCDTIIVMETSLHTDFDYLTDTKFQIFRKKEYKSNQHVFIKVKK